MYIMKIQGNEERVGLKKLFLEIMAENYQKEEKGINL